MRCGFYETEITPPMGGSIFGYLQQRIGRNVVTKLYAKAAVLEQEGTCVVFLVLDTLGIPMGLPEVVKKRVYEQTGIAENNILIAATHSHTSLPVMLGKEPYQNPELDQKILDMTALLAADAIIMAYKKLQTVNVRFGIGCAKGISFVREYYMKDGKIRTNPTYCKEDVVNPYSEPDTDLPVFFFTDSDGKPLGAITSFALHHCTTGLKEELSADYSYYVAQDMKNTFGNQFVTLFYSGFCGNINHLDYCGEPFKHTTQEIGEVLTRELLYTISKAEPVTGDVLSVKMDTVKIQKRELEPGFLDSVKNLVKNPPTEEEMCIADPYSDKMKYVQASKVLLRYDEDKRTEYDVPVQVIKIGDCLIYALIGEMFSQFGDMIRNGSPSKKNLLVELAHLADIRCYIPVPELYSIPTVYEATVYSACLAIDAGDLMVNKALEIAEEIY